MTDTIQQVALVTGASRGIGRAIALKLAEDGFTVVVTYAGNAKLAEQVVADIKANGGDGLALQADIGDSVSVTQLFDAILKAFGRLDVVVNNAGVMQMATISSDNVEILDHMLATNLRGTWLVMARAAELLGNGGRIIALSSSVLANEMRGRGISVNAVAPGPVATEMFFEGKSDEQIASIAAMAPLERLGQPEEIAAAVAFLASPQGSWINGQILRANGGFA